MNVLPTLVRREFWEHRALWVAPLVVAGLIVLGALVAGHGHDGMRIDVDGRPIGDASRPAGFAVLQLALSIPQFMVMLVVLFFYAIDCLYSERRDRSILFWKSLPVSDAQTVISKLLVALLLVPLGVYLLALVVDLLATGILHLRFPDIASRFIPWDAGAWFQLQGLMLIGLLVAMLWYAPVLAYLLLVSAWARRNVFLWAVLPPVFALIAEEIAFDTDYVKNLIGSRLGGPWEELGLRQGLGRIDEGDGLELARIFGALDGSVLASAELWLGALAAAVLVWGAVRIRRYRDDT